MLLLADPLLPTAVRSPQVHGLTPIPYLKEFSMRRSEGLNPIVRLVFLSGAAEEQGLNGQRELRASWPVVPLFCAPVVPLFCAPVVPLFSANRRGNAQSACTSPGGVTGLPSVASTGTQSASSILTSASSNLGVAAPPNQRHWSTTRWSCSPSRDRGAPR